MRPTVQLRMTKAASPLALATGSAAAVPYVPWSTGRTLYRDMTGAGHKDDISQSLTTDAGRAIGGALGGQTARGLASHWGAEGSPMLRAAILLGGTGVGATLGHMKGHSIGQDLFPGTLRDRLQRAADKF